MADTARIHRNGSYVPMVYNCAPGDIVGESIAMEWIRLNKKDAVSDLKERVAYLHSTATHTLRLQVGSLQLEAFLWMNPTQVV